MTKKKAKGATATTALAVVAPEVALPAMLAERATAKTVEVLTGDIVVIHTTKRNPGSTKKNPLPDIEIDYHVNIAAIGLGALLAALGALGAVIAWNGFSTVGGGFDGIRGTRGHTPSSGNTVVDFFAGIGDLVLAPFKKLTGQS